MSSSDNGTRDAANSESKKQFKSIQYQEMMDDSKHTEEIDISRSDFTETQSQETLRNLSKVAQNGMNQQNIDLKQVNKHNDGATYENLPDEETQRNYIRNLEQSNINAHIFTQEEEDKTHDNINHHEDDYEDIDPKNNRRVNTDGNIEYMKGQINGIEGSAQNGQKQFRNKVSKIGSISMKSHFPSLKLNVPLYLSSSDIFEIFVNVSKREKFQVIEMEQGTATAVNKEQFSFKRMFMRCIPFQDYKKEQPTDSFISAIKLEIRVNEVKCCRKIILKGVYGEFNRLQEFVNIFRTRVHEAVDHLNLQQKGKNGQMMVRKKSSGNVNTSATQGNRQKKKGKNILTTLGSKKHYMNQNSDDDESDEEKQSKGFTETSSFYQIHKILSSEQYTLGQNVQQYIECFQMQYKSLRESSQLLPQPMEGIMGLVNETVFQFNSEYNLGKDSAKSLMQFCRPAVEKYIFSKLYDKIFAMYAIKNEEEDRLFIEKSMIIKKMKPSDIMTYLGINQKFIISEHLNFTSRTSFIGMDQSKYQSLNRDSLNPFKADTVAKDHHNDSSNFETQRSDTATPVVDQSDLAGSPQNIMNNNSVMGGMGMTHSKSDLPYSEAIKCIEKIQQFTSPREKIECISEAFGCLKTAVVDHWKGKLELNTMDDVLPLSIYVMAMAELSHPASEFNMLDDYLRIYDKGYDLEKKLLTNFEVSIKYVNHEWELQ